MVTDGDDKAEGLLSPKFRSVAAMAGWDEEALLMASLVVEDTPDRLSKQKKRSDLLHFKTPPTNSRRKRRAQKRSPASITVTVLDLDDQDTAKQESEKEEAESTSIEKLDKKGDEALEEQGCSVATSSTKKIEPKSIEKADTKVAEASEEQGCSVSSSSAAFPSIDLLREELSCAICLEICFEPSTTPCGHSFCKKCLRSAADKCGKKCPKCRQLISNGRSCTVNTVLWNTIQLLFPKEVETRKAAADLSSREAKRQSPVTAVATHSNSRTTRVLLLNSPESGPSSQERRNSRAMRRQSARASGMPSRNRDINSRRELPSQDGDAALALRMQREEFMESFRTRSSDDEQYRSSLALARANLRAMASRAINIRVRGGRGS
ncbi:putative E3 ubiquitin-protein ligase RING1a [Solanum pennellii]|uniref:RING-type E3 ubiquitin transferase n=1 Tax=Solanum pennellii TaxID=28526 RepID=A0ABM1G5F8_SOLPN|nr:putative E3 ubiquitin-protein ligase RING1a [Solanum pennellii]